MLVTYQFLYTITYHYLDFYTTIYFFTGSCYYTVYKVHYCKKDEKYEKQGGNYMKKIASLLTITLLLFIAFSFVTPSTVHAEVLSENEMKEPNVSTLFSNYIDAAFNGFNKLCVIDNNGLDITEKFIAETSIYYSSKDYKSIQELIITKNLQISYQEITAIADLKALSIAPSETQHVSQKFYHIATESTGRFTKEWVTGLYGRYSYDLNNLTIISVYSPTLNLDVANFGAYFSPYLSNITGLMQFAP